MITSLRLSWYDYPFSTQIRVRGPYGFDQQAVAHFPYLSVELGSPGEYFLFMRHVSKYGVYSLPYQSKFTIGWRTYLPDAPRVVHIDHVSGIVRIILHKPTNTDINGIELKYT